MNLDRAKDLAEDFSKAFGRLEEALGKDVDKAALVVDATIQRFEFTFELAWKFLQAVLRFQGAEAATPRAAIKEAFRAGLLADGDGWIDMLEDRNKTSHLYDEAGARMIYEKIKARHFPLLEKLKAAVPGMIRGQSA